MSNKDLTTITPGDLVEYQGPISKQIMRGEFRGWHGDEPQRLLVYSFGAKTVISVAQKNIVRVTPQGGSDAMTDQERIDFLQRTLEETAAFNRRLRERNEALEKRYAAAYAVCENLAEHEPLADATEDTPKTCTCCGYSWFENDAPSHAPSCAWRMAMIIVQREEQKD